MVDADENPLERLPISLMGEEPSIDTPRGDEDKSALRERLVCLERVDELSK